MTTNRSSGFLLFAIFALLPTTRAQDKRLTMSGNVTDSRSHQPVEGAKVTVVGNKANPEITDRDGNFILTFSASTSEGEVVRVRIEKTGYKVYEIHKPVSPTMPLQFSIDRIAPTGPPRGTSRESTSTHPLPPLKASGRSPVVENTRKLAVMIPFDTAPKSAPIPLDENPDDPLFRTYLRFQSLATNGTVPDDIRNAEEQGPLSWEARPVSTNEAPSFLAQMLRYYVFYTIDSLQRDSLTVSVGYPAQARAGIEPPDAEPYLYDRLSKDIGENAFFKPLRHRLSGDEMAWRTKPVRMPKGTEIQFLQDSDSYVVCLRRPDHYRADFSVKVFAGTGLGSVPKYFSTSHISTTMQWTFILTMHYSIEQPEDTNFNPTAYAQWLDSLFDGLRKQLTLE